ncbi:alpha/beta hydrolase [Kineococcus sp. R8]|uniref:esterase/lipase family protein n=1 Tax=Kineococcus siccus TaxID=2696567 RepID=UPI00141205B2|nr:alpha/beta hydrolase [Kineococcus siccus]NAZ84417.1 alpha/beta hydrolase [Kineococcus siccus]
MRRADVLRWVVLDLLDGLRWEARSLRRTVLGEEFATGRPGFVPVVLVPGVYESWRFLQPLTEALHAAGHPVHVVDDLGFNGGDIAEAAERVRRSVDEAGVGPASGVALVGHSKGGLIGKQVLVRHNADGRFRQLVTVNTPFAGSVRARWLPLPALRVFVPGSPLLRDLAVATHVDAAITSVFSAVDPVVPGNDELPGATNVRLDTVGHFRVLSDPRLHEVVLRALRDGSARAPGSPA